MGRDVTCTIHLLVWWFDHLTVDFDVVIDTVRNDGNISLLTHSYWSITTLCLVYLSCITLIDGGTGLKGKFNEQYFAGYP